MAHMIDFSNNRANIAYQGEKPWHGLGTNINKDADLDQWRVAAGLNWEALKGQECFKMPVENGPARQGRYQETSDFILYRSDTLAKLGNITDRYNVVQPREVIEFYSDLVKLEGWHMEVAGCLDGGKRIWALAKTNQEFSINGTLDVMDTYLLLATSFDGSLATIGKFTSVRVVCQNTLTMSLGDKAAIIKVSHGTAFDPEKMKQQLGISQDATNQAQEEFNALAQRKLNKKEAMRFIVDVLAGKGTDENELSTRQANIIKNVYQLYDGRGFGATLPSANDTAWGAVNAITQYVDHTQGRNVNNRMRSAWFGTGEQTKLEAKKLALALVA